MTALAATTAPATEEAAPATESGCSATLEPTLPTPEGTAAGSLAAPRAASGAPLNAPAASSTASAEAADEEDGEESAVDHAATASLLASATDYMRRNDYQSALQVYNYLRKRCKEWESPMVELKVLSNTSLCLQRLRGRLPELISACNETLRRIGELRTAGDASRAPEDTLLSMECACLSRRGSAYAQQQRTEESNRDAARVRELLAKTEKSS